MNTMKKLTTAPWVLLFSSILQSLIPGLSLEAQATRPMTIRDPFAIESVGNAEISPDGEWVAFTLRTTDLEADESETRIWMVSTDGGDPLPLTVSGESASGPQWSPDGRFLVTSSDERSGNNLNWRSISSCLS